MSATTQPNHTDRLAPLFIAVNAASGQSSGPTPQDLRDMLTQAGHLVTLCEIPSGTSPLTHCESIVQQAVSANGIVVAAGGDGTVAAIAALCYTHHATMAVLPLGTFNYFARALGIPTALEEAIALLATSQTRSVSAGFIGNRLFLNNASFGLYPKIIRKREAATSRFGRRRLVAAISAISSLFHAQKKFAIRLHREGETELHRTSMVFVGNNSFQLDNFGLEVGECTRNNQLAVVILNHQRRLEIARIIWRGILKNLHLEEKLTQFCAAEFEVESSRRSMDVVVDGEIIHCATPLSFRVEADAIRIVAPMEAA